VLVRPIAVSNVWMIGILNNDWKGIREETVVPKLKNCAYVYLEARRKTTYLHAGIVV